MLSYYTEGTWILLFCKLLCSYFILDKEYTYTAATRKLCLVHNTSVYYSTRDTFLYYHNKSEGFNHKFRSSIGQAR